MIRRRSIRSVAVTAIVVTVAVLAVDTAKGWWMGPYQAFIVSLNALVGWAFIGAGWVIVERRPGNLVGPLLLAYGVVWAAAAPLDLYASLPIRQVHGGHVVLALRAISAILSVLFIVALLVFPDGRLPSRRWRIVVAIAIVGASLGLAGWALGIRPINPAFPKYLSPLAIRGFDRATLITVSEWLVDVATWSIVLAFVIRWRRANAVERAQFKWVIAATALLGAITVVATRTPSTTSRVQRHRRRDRRARHRLVAVGDRGRDPPLPAVRDRSDRQPLDRVRDRHRRPARAYAAVILALQGPILGPLTGGETSPSPSRPSRSPRSSGHCVAASSTRRPTLRPGSLRRRADLRGVQRAPARRRRHRFGDRRPADDGRRGRPPGTDGRVASAGRAMIARWLIRIVADRRRSRPAGRRDRRRRERVSRAPGRSAFYASIVDPVRRRRLAPRRATTRRTPWGRCCSAFGAGLRLVSASRSVPSPAGDRPGGRVRGLFVSMLDAPMFVLLALILILFPDGQLPSPRWWPVPWIAVASIVLTIVGAMLDGGAAAPLSGIHSPFGSPGSRDRPGLRLVRPDDDPAGAAARRTRHPLASRRRDRAGADQVGGGGGLVLLVAEIINVATFRPDDPIHLTTILVIVAIALLPIAIGIAVLRYRLYAIDRIVSRGIAYALVTALLGATFVGIILALQWLLSSFTQEQTIAVAASTLVVFALFQPLRRRVQAAGRPPLRPRPL